MGPAGRWGHVRRSGRSQLMPEIPDGMRGINSAIGMTIRNESSFTTTRENEHTLAG